jgi:hypothetical protein
VLFGKMAENDNEASGCSGGEGNELIEKIITI